MEPMVGQGPPYDGCIARQTEGRTESSRSSLKATKRPNNTEASANLMVGQAPPYVPRGVKVICRRDRTHVLHASDHDAAAHAGLESAAGHSPLRAC